MNRDFFLAIALSFLVLLGSRYLLEPYFQPEPSEPTSVVEPPSTEPEPASTPVIPGIAQ